LLDQLPLSPREIFWVPSYKVKVVDTTGGDDSVFRAGTAVLGSATAGFPKKEPQAIQ
jgi:sugar/nucleoside kinase (ribokinase family)